MFLEGVNLPMIPYPVDFYSYRNDDLLNEVNWVYINGYPVHVGYKGEVFLVEVVKSEIPCYPGCSYLADYQIMIKNLCNEKCEGRVVRIIDCGDVIQSIRNVIKKTIMEITEQSLTFYK